MANLYIEKEDIFDAFKESKDYMKVFFDPLDEYERIARNKPHPNIEKNYPKVTDGTTASIIQKTPRRIIQQIPTGLVVGDIDDWLSIVASFIFTKQILPNANSQFDFYQKCIHIAKKSLTYGAAHSYVPFVSRGKYIGTDLLVPYVKDVYFEAGKVSNGDSNIKFLSSWYQPRDIEAIIKKEKDLKARASERGETYESGWNLKELANIKDSIQQKNSDEQSNYEKSRSDHTHNGGVQLVTCFQEGIGGEFYTFSPKERRIVRTKQNKDPRGLTPIQTMYSDTDGFNPIGYGLVEQVGALQNLIDSEMQMYQFNRALSLAPPIIKKGDYSKSQIKLVPNHIMDLGVNPQNSAEAFKVDTSAIANFPQNYGLMKSQLLNITSSPDTSVSAEVGNPGFSKTDSGVKQLASNVSVDDNYFRKQFESWFAEWAESAINIYFGERQGVEEIQLDKETADKLRKIDPTLVSEDNKVVVDFDTATPQLKFEVDASTSNMKNDAQQLEALDGLLARMDGSQVLQQIIPPEKVLAAWNSVVTASAVENPEELKIDVEEWKQQQAEQQMAEQAQMEQMANAAATAGLPTEQPTEPVEPPAEPPTEAPQLTADDMAFITALRDMGYDDNKIGQAMAMQDTGMSDEEIMDMLEAI